MTTSPSQAMARLVAQRPDDVPAILVPSAPLWPEDLRESDTPPQSVRATRTWVGVAAVAAVVAAALAAFALWPAAPMAVAATPAKLAYAPVSEDPSTALRELRDAALTTPDKPTAGPVFWVKSRGWHLSTTMTTVGEYTSSRISEVRREQWLTSDGTLRIAESRDGQPSTVPTVSTISPESMSQLTALLNATSPDEILAVLGPDASSYAIFDAWANLTSNTVVPSAANAAFLALMENRADVDLLGTTIDRADRAGVAVATTRVTDNYEEQLTLIIAPDTGRLIARELTALTSGPLPINAPAVTGYTMWMDFAQVDPPN